MFTFLGVLFVIVGTLPLIGTLRKASQLEESVLKRRVATGAVVLVVDILALIAINVFFHFYTEYLWFHSLGYENRFFLEITSKVFLYLAGAAVAFVLLYVPLRLVLGPGASKPARTTVLLVSLAIGLLMGLWTGGMWSRYLLFANQAASGVRDPVFGMPINFYLFSLPFYGGLTGYFTSLFLVSGLTTVAAASLQINARSGQSGAVRQWLGPVRRIVLLLASALFVVFALNTVLNVYRILYSTHGAVHGAGWTDVHVRTIGYYITIAVYLGVAAVFAVGAFSDRVLLRVFALQRLPETGAIRARGRSLIAPGAVIAGLILVNSAVPSLVQNLVVRPNEITLESEYIPHNIQATQAAFNIDEKTVEERTFPVGRNISREVIDENSSTLANIRLWDWRALIENLRQQQEIRLYYEFHDVDIDRYTIDGEYRQMMLSVRELEKNELDPSSQTWVSRQLKYTHGYGLVMLPVHEFLPQGRPDLLIRNIPPVVNVESLQVTRPEVYYGERTAEHVYVKTTQQEFDYPSGDENVYATYEGEGGVTIGGFLREFMFAWKFDGVRLLFSGYFTPESRIMFRRRLKERIEMLAPFLMLDRDPYPVLTDEGRIKYIVDAYTVSSGYPYSQPYAGALSRFQGLNYMRNAVKIVVDAYDGSVDFYVYDESDVIVNTYRNVFPELFRSAEEMDDFLREHVRYPADYLTVQADVYGTYHMDDYQVFYQREDVWQFATERYRESFQMVEPYYVMVNLPNGPGLEFVIMIPFTPKNKNVINAWMAGRSDVPNYGKIIVYTLPKGVEVLGPRQIEARIDQDTDMSRMLSLWGQRGSEVIRGNLLAIPLFANETLYVIFAEPIYLQAEDAALPEIKRVALADQDDVVWAETFDQALDRLVGAAPRPEPAASPMAAAPAEVQSLAEQAAEEFDAFTQSLGRGDYAGAGESLDALAGTMEQLSGQVAGAAAGSMEGAEE